MYVSDSGLGGAIYKASSNNAVVISKRNPTANNEYHALYLDTGGSTVFDDFTRQTKFKHNPYPAVLSTGKPDEDTMLLMNDGIDFFQDPWQNFDRFYSVYLNNDELETRHYIFFVRPGCYIVDEKGTVNGRTTFELSKKSHTYDDHFMRYMLQNHEVILRSLTEEFGRTINRASYTGEMGSQRYGNQLTDDNGRLLGNHMFIPWLVGKTESLSIPDYILKNFTLVQPYTKYGMPYGTSAIESQSGGTFECTFKEDKELRTHKFFYTWLYYIDGVMRDRFRPKDRYILYNSFDYMSSVYHIICDVTGENILWWDKFTGVFPTQAPNSDLSWNKGGRTENKLTIPFTYFHHEALNPQILTDFNYNSLGYDYMRDYVEKSGGKIDLGNAIDPLYNSDMGTIGTNLVGRPFITSFHNGYQPKLRWMRASSEGQLI